MTTQLQFIIIAIIIIIIIIINDAANNADCLTLVPKCTIINE